MLRKRSKQFVAGSVSILAHAYPSILPGTLHLMKAVTEIGTVIMFKYRSYSDIIGTLLAHAYPSRMRAKLFY